MKNLMAAAAAFVFAVSAQAQNAAPAPSPAKKELIQKLVTQQQSALELAARNLAAEPALQLRAAAGNALGRVPEDKRKAVAAQVDGLLNKYVTEAEPLARERAAKVGQASLGAWFDEKFTEDELRQLLVALDAPAYKKYQQIVPDFGSAYRQKLITELQPVLDPRLKTLEQNVAAAMGLTVQQAAQPAAAKPPASAASKPAKK